MSRHMNMSNPPAGASLLFGALAQFGRIKQHKDGSHRMVLMGVDVINWFTDRPDRKAGSWTPQKLIEKWDSMFSMAAPNAQASVFIDSKQQLSTFEMHRPMLNKNGAKLKFKITGIGKSNDDIITSLAGRKLEAISLFIDDGSEAPTCYPNCYKADLSGSNLSSINLSEAILANANLEKANLSNANLYKANLSNANLTGANLTTTLNNVNLSSANLTNANLSNSLMTQADLLGANLTGANLKNTVQDNANLADVDLTKAKLNNSLLINADLRGANLTGADLSGVNLTNADLSGANRIF